MDATSSGKDFKKKGKTIWNKIISGVSSSSKAIIKTPAQDRLSRLRNKLLEDQKKFGLQSQLNNYSGVKPSCMRSSTSKGVCSKHAHLSKAVSAGEKSSVESTSGASSQKSILDSDIISVMRTIQAARSSTVVNNTNKQSPVKYGKEELASSSKALSQEVSKVNRRHNKEPLALDKGNDKDKSPSIASILSNWNDQKQLPVDLKRTRSKRKYSSTDTSIPEKHAKTSPEERLPHVSRKSSKSSANDRLDRLRKSLQKETNRKEKERKPDLVSQMIDTDEEMPMAPIKPHWEPSPSSSLLSGVSSFFKTLGNDIKTAFGNFIDIKENYSNAINAIQSDVKSAEDCIYLVPDTNIFIHHLTFIKDVVDKVGESNSNTKIYVPYVVIEELDRLKEQTDRSVSTLAMRAIKYLNEKLEKRDEAVQGQTAVEAIERTIPTKFADDSILNCCLQLRKKGFQFILLSNDINLRNKALVNNVKALASADVDLTDVSKYL